MLKALFEQQIPFNKLLGIQLVSAGEGEGVIVIRANPALIGDPSRPALHGGVLSAMADAAGGLAVFTRLPPGDSVSTVDLRIDYLRPGAVDQDIFARAQVIRLGNRVAATDCVVYQDSVDAPIAVVRAVYNVVRRG